MAAESAVAVLGGTETFEVEGILVIIWGEKMVICLCLVGYSD